MTVEHRTVPVPAHIAAGLTHRAGCPTRGLWALVDRSNQRMTLQCPNCGARRWLHGRYAVEVAQLAGIDPDTLTLEWGRRAGEPKPKPAATASHEAVEPEPEPAPGVITDPATPARWWCREHSRPVSWHGRDCPGCQHDRDAARTRRTARRRAARTEE